MIERLYVHNYRCFENFTLDLKGRPSALVIGKNGSGKSTLRQALGVLQLACQPLRIGELFSRLDFTRNQTDLPMRFEVDVTLKNWHYEYSIAFEWPKTHPTGLVIQEKMTVDGVTVFVRDRESFTLPESGTFKMDLPGPFLRMIGNVRLGEAVYEFRRYFSSALLLSPVPDRMSGYAEGEQDYLHSHASNFGGWLKARLNRQPARYAEMMKYIQAVMPDLASFDSVEIGERGAKLRVHFDRPSPDKSESLSLDFSQLSDGEKCFFLSAAVVAFNRKESPLFCFWDEPDNHLAPNEVSHFVMELRRMVHNGGQFLATSHHPETVRRFSDENTLVFTRNSHLEPTVVRPLSEIGYRGDLVNALLRGEVIE